MSRRRRAAAPAAVPNVPAVAAHPDALCVIVYRGHDALFVLDEPGRVLAPPTMLERATVALALAQAGGALASLPLPEPQTFAERMSPAIAALAALGTPEAEQAIIALGDAVELSNAAFAASAPSMH